jgi:hypothetical protein
MKCRRIVSKPLVLWIICFSLIGVSVVEADPIDTTSDVIGRMVILPDRVDGIMFLSLGFIATISAFVILALPYWRYLGSIRFWLECVIIFIVLVALTDVLTVINEGWVSGDWTEAIQMLLAVDGFFLLWLLLSGIKYLTAAANRQDAEDRLQQWH